ncbi:MAG TPA: hypothetical protein ACFCUD_15025 [Cyclobacteriaceae bacterium]
MPDLSSNLMRMELLEGAGLSTQISDLASFFLTLGVCIFIGIKTQNRIWFYPAILMLVFTAFGRCVTWLLHGAFLPIDMIIIEVFTAVLLFYASNKLRNENRQ